MSWVHISWVHINKQETGDRLHLYLKNLLNLIDMEFLENTFQAFADFGSGSSKTVLSGQLNVQKFNKLCKDTKIHGDGITSTDTDIIFAKV